MTSLSSVVSNIVRSSIGASNPRTAVDDDLDRHVAELIVREAKKKAERYGQQGIRAYISRNLADTNAPKTNKRFLTSIIKSTDEHNKTVLKAQALAAQEVKRERDALERRQRRARAEEAAEAERLRRGTKRRKTEDDEGWDRWNGRTADRKRSRTSRDWETWDGYDDDGVEERRRQSHHSSSRSRATDEKDGSARKSRKVRADESDDPSRKLSRRNRSRSSSPKDHNMTRSRKSTRRARSRSKDQSYRLSRHQSTSSRHLSPNSTNDLKRTELKPSNYNPNAPQDNINSSRHSSPVFLQGTLTSQASTVSKVGNLEKSSRRSTHSPSPSSRSSTPGPEPPVQLPSKMDRYFEESYDPRLDITPLVKPNVPATGLIDSAEFEGWDTMLELIRLRREDKEEKKRLERLGLVPKDKKKSKKKVALPDSAPGVIERWTTSSVSVMDIEYKKRGSVREWDMGKEGM